MFNPGLNLAISYYDSFLIQNYSTKLSPGSTNEPSNESEVTPEDVNEPPIEETPLLPQISNDFGLDIDSIISAGDPEYVR